MIKKSTKRKISNFVKSKGGKATIICSAVFLIVGIASLIFGYALTYGWQSILNWFTSRYAILVYAGIDLYIIILLNIIFIAKSWDE